MVVAIVILFFVAALFCTFMSWWYRRGSSMFMRRDRDRHVYGRRKQSLAGIEDVQYVSAAQKWLLGAAFSFSILALFFVIETMQDGSFSTSEDHSVGRYAIFRDLIVDFIGEDNFLLIGAVFCWLGTLVLFFISFRSSYRETDTYCIIERRGKKKRLDFANIRSYKLSYRPGVLAGITVVDASGEKFQFNLLLFEADSLAKYLIQLATGELEQLLEKNYFCRSTELVKETSEKGKDLDALVSYRKYLVEGV